ncbi:class I SAM-dependent methyltransferase [Paractinoplanes lichenicola]|uniref:Class I SAM-dependent methyltransferase n=1 Tax=Paractinoplanes lichenicola TaxID=2802976 RepID=A0ABS1VY93_9ACTN|nr:class I SAM-dependent methyltransferase [Actinoplanes lichenicola]MBL7259455.1 class I SAM-dependent methyltransferase [Actinoplanes lichenicola]
MANLGHLFNDVPDLYDRVRPGYPEALFDDLAALAGLHPGSPVLEVGAGTGQATVPLVARGFTVTALEPGHALAALARKKTRLDVIKPRPGAAGAGTVEPTSEAVRTDFAEPTFKAAGADVIESTFEQWEAGSRRFDAVVAASSWHWVDPAVGWRKAHDVLRPGGRLALLGHVVIRRPDEPEVYAETADLHERYSPGNPDWGHPPVEQEVRNSDQSLHDLFAPTIVRWYPTEQHFDGQGFADHLRSNSPYRRLPADVREPLLDAVADRIRTHMDNHAVRRYLTVLRIGQRN